MSTLDGHLVQKRAALARRQERIAAGALGSGLTHGFLIQATAWNVALDLLEVEITAACRTPPPDRVHLPKGSPMFRATRRAALLASAMALGLAAATGADAADPTRLVIGYQPIVEPSKVPQADGLYEKATGAAIDWRKFESGAEAIAAIASGSLDIAYVGSSPAATAASRELPVEVFLIAGLIGESEALVAKGVEKPQDLAGKRIATPFVSTAHYSLLSALEHWDIDPKSVSLLNLRPPEIAAAWERGDLDGAYVWDPVLALLKKGGKTIVTSAEIAGWGHPTFDAWIVRKDYAEAHPDVVKAFVRITGQAYDTYLADPAAWGAGSDAAAKIARLSGAKPEEVPALLTGYEWPTLAQQAGTDLLGGGTAKALAATSAFLAEQGKVPAVLADYGPYVTARFATEALSSN